MDATIDLYPLQDQKVGPRKFLQMLRNGDLQDYEVTIIPARLGRPGFGGFRLTKRTPIYGRRPAK